MFCCARVLRISEVCELLDLVSSVVELTSDKQPKE
jgi:hypothetical protein